MSNKKVRAAGLSIASNTFLIILKTAAGIASGSVSVLSEAIHSSMDLIASIIAFFSVRMSDNPPDKEHPYGHGKIENVSGVIEAGLIFIAAAWIIYEAIEKIINKSEIESVHWGFIVMIISSFVNILVSRQLYKVAKETDSVALEADALHLKTDVYTSVGVAIGLFAIWITNIHILDPIFAILVAMLIIRESYNLLKRAFGPLLDISIEAKELKKIENELRRFPIHSIKIRSRKSGKYKFLDLNFEMDSDLSLSEVHDVCDEIEESLKAKISNLEIQIHVEPRTNSDQ